MTSVLLTIRSLMLFPVQDQDAVRARLEHAAEVIDELLNAPVADAPAGLIDETECIAVIPEVRATAFRFGHGVVLGGPVSCRTDVGWNAPSMLLVNDPAFGLQIGVFKDVVHLFVDRDSIEYMTGNEHPPGPFADGPKIKDLGAGTNFTFDD